MGTMNCERILEFIPKALDGEALDWELEAVAEHVATCADCAAAKRELLELGGLVRAPVRAAVAEADFSGMWRAVERGMDRVDRESLVARRRTAGAFFGGRVAARLAWIGAAASIAAVAVSGPIARLAPLVADNHVDVTSVDAGRNQTVTVYTNPDDDVTFIWVDEDEGAKS